MSGVSPVAAAPIVMKPSDLAALRQDLGRRREELEKRRANLDEIERLMGELYPTEWEAALDEKPALPEPKRRPQLPPAKRVARPRVKALPRRRALPTTGKAAPKALPPPASVPAVVPPRTGSSEAAQVRDACPKLFALQGAFTSGDMARHTGLNDTGRVNEMLKTLVRQGVLEMETRMGRQGNLFWLTGKKLAAVKAAPVYREHGDPKPPPPVELPAPTMTQRQTVLRAACDARGTFTTAELAVMTNLDRKTVSAVCSVLCKEAHFALVRARPDGANIYEITTVGRRAAVA